MGGSRGDILAGRAYVELFVKDSKFLRGMRNMRNKFRQFGADMTALGRQLVVISAAMLIPLALSVKTFADFDDAIRKVGARSRGTAAELVLLREQASKLGRETSFTAVQVAELMARVGQKGFDRSAIRQMTEDILNLQRAAGDGSGDTTIAANLVSGNLRAFGLEANQSANLADLFSAAVNNSNFNLEGLTDSLSTAAPIAKRYNIGIKDTVNVLAQMTNVNIDASAAGTAFRNILLKLSDATGRSKFNASIKAMTGNTVDFVDQAGNLRPLPDLLFEIGDSIKGLGTAQQGDILSNLFGLRAVVGGGVLSEARNGFGELNDILSDVGGTAAKTAKEMDSGIGGTFRILLSAVAGVKKEIGSALAGAISNVANQFNDFLNGMAEIIKKNKDAVGSFAKWALVIGAAGGALLAVGITASFVSVSIGGLLAIVSLASTAFGVLILPVTVVRVALSILSTVVAISRAVFLSLVAAMAFVRASFVAVAAIFALSKLRIVAVTIATILYRSAIAAVVSVMAIYRGLVISASLAMATFGLVTGAVKVATLLWEAVTATATAALSVYFAVVVAGTSILNFLRASTVAVTAVLGLMTAAYTAVTTSATIATIATQAFAAVGAILGALTSPIALVSFAVAGLSFVLFRALGGFQGMASIATTAMESVGRVSSALSGRFLAVFGEIKKTVLTTFQGVKDAISSGNLQLAGEIALLGLRLAFLQGMQAISDIVSGVWGDTISTFSTQIAGGDFQGAWETVVLAMDSAWSNFTAGLLSGFISASRKVLQVWKDTVQGISDEILNFAAGNDTFNAAFKLFSGVDVQDEIAKNSGLEGLRKNRARKNFESDKVDIQQELSVATAAGDTEAITQLNKELATTIKNIADLDGESPPDIFSKIGKQGQGDPLDQAADISRNFLGALAAPIEFFNRDFNEIAKDVEAGLKGLEDGPLASLDGAAKVAGENLAKGVEGGAEKAKTEIEKLQDELAKKAAEAAASRKKADEKEKTGPGLPGSAAAGAGGGGLGGKLGKASPVTFSAAGLLAITQGGGRESMVTRSVDKVRLAVEKSTEKIAEVGFSKNQADAVWRARIEDGLRMG